MSAHTPGPWEAVGSIPEEGVNCFWINSEDGQTIASGYGYQSEPVRQANARLIAAAPKLLDALRGLIDWLNGDISYTLDDHLGKARAAIAKATGAAS